AAKGYTTRASLQAVHAELLEQLNGAPIREFFYCFHRAEDRCECRKPEPFFVLEAAKKYEIDRAASWFVGDVDTDVEAGRRAGCRSRSKVSATNSMRWSVRRSASPPGATACS